MRPPVLGFGDLLRTARHRRGLSQLALADAAEVSTRHLSFIECGRSRPSYATTQRLVAALDPDVRTAGALFAAAGFAAPAAAEPAAALASPPMAVMTPAGQLLASNAALERAFGLLDDVERRWIRTCGDEARNLLLLSFHPEGLAPFMENHDEIARLTLAPLARRAPRCRESARTLARLRQFPRVRAVLDAGLPDTAASGPVSERYRFGARRLRFTSVYVPLDDQHLQALFVPADARTRRLIEAKTLRA